MGYYILHRPASPPPGSHPAPSAEETAGWGKQLENGSDAERRRALLSLVSAQAEPELVRCLASADPAVVQLAAAGLWECWLGEEGTNARRQMEEGVDTMNHGRLEQASRTFAALMQRYPDWAEAINKQATVLYLQGEPEKSIALCRRVVAIKKDHFGAWNGMAICAIQIEDWDLALQAVHESLRLQPYSAMNHQLLGLIQSRLPQV